MTDELAMEDKLGWFETKARFLLRDSIDLHHRTLFLHGKVNERSFSKFSKQLRLFEGMGESPVTLMIDSEGGDVYSMFSFIDRIRQSSVEIITIGTGLIASAALPIFAAGTRRYAGLNASFMHHAISCNMGDDKVPIQDNELKHMKDLQKRFAKFLASKSNKPYTFWLGSGKHTDFYFDAEKAVELGLADDTF